MTSRVLLCETGIMNLSIVIDAGIGEDGNSHLNTLKLDL